MVRSTYSELSTLPVSSGGGQRVNTVVLLGDKLLTGRYTISYFFLEQLGEASGSEPLTDQSVVSANSAHLKEGNQICFHSL